MTEETGAVAAAEPVATPDPIVPTERAQSTGEAVDRAFEKVFSDEPKAAEAPSEQPRGPDGKFAPKTPTEAADSPETAPPVVQTPEPVAPVSDAPARLSAEAKAAWAQTPAHVQAEVNRAFKEMETGIAKYRETVEPLRPFIERANSQGQHLSDVLATYTGIEQELGRNPIKGLELVCQNMGLRLQDIAAQVLGQPAPARDEVIDGLKQELAGLKQQVGGVTTTIQEQRAKQTSEAVAAFAAANPRFDELAGEIAEMLRTGYASDLQDAYTKADRLNPGTAPITPIPPVPQTPKAGISIQGAPGPGSNPSASQRSVTNGEALDRAFSAVGIA